MTSPMKCVMTMGLLLSLGTVAVAEQQTPQALAAEKALVAIKVDAPPEQAYAAFNDFCRTHFGAEFEPLLYEKLGHELKFIKEGEWRHVSENSASVAWETNLPATSYVEYGPTTAYGQKTEPTDRNYFLHLHMLTGLETGKTYHYRLVAVDERGNRLVSADQVLQTAPIPGAIYLKQSPDGAPQKLRESGTYVLKEDLTVPGNAITTYADNITIDLNGHTISFANGDEPKDANGIIANGTHDKSKLPYMATNLKIFNGTIRQGESQMLKDNTNSLNFNAMVLKGQDLEVAGVRVIYHAPEAWGVQMSHNSGDVRVHHNIFKDMGTKITNRHGQAVRSMGFRFSKDSPNNFQIDHNLVQRTRQNGIGEAHTMHNNEIYVDSWSTNSFAIQPESKPGIDAGEHYNNRIFGTGFNAYGFGWAHENLKVHDNLIFMFGLNTIDRWGERWGDVNLLAGMRITNYGQGGQVRNNLQYWNNLIIMEAKDGAEVQGTRFFSDVSIEGTVFRNNTVKMMSLDKQTNKGACIVAQGHHTKLDSKPVFYRDNRLISNYNIVAFGDSYGKGNNHHFENCTFERAGNDPRFHTFTFGGAFFSLGHVILDGTFVGGAAAQDIYWTKTGSQSTYSIAWTLQIKTAPNAAVRIADASGHVVFNGQASSDGSLAVPLTQCEIRPLEWNASQSPQEGKGVTHLDEHQVIACTPHQVTVILNGQPTTRTVNMTQRQSLEVR